jgi:membrane-bound metal-dependent hydrolase YbcI (DUF457 family)
MTGHGHRITGCILATITAPMALDMGMTGYLMAIFTIIGASAPDFLEIRAANGNTVIKHRTITHYVPLWIALLAYGCLPFIPLTPPLPTPNAIVSEIIIGFSLGGLLHLLWDLPNPMGIPVFTPYRRLSLNLWRSGKAEWLIFILMGGMSVWYWGVFDVMQTYLVNTSPV